MSEAGDTDSFIKSVNGQDLPPVPKDLPMSEKQQVLKLQEDVKQLNILNKELQTQLNGAAHRIRMYATVVEMLHYLSR